MATFDYEAKAIQAFRNTRGKLPKAGTDPHSAVQAANASAQALFKSLESFFKGKGELEKKVLDAQNKYGAAKNTFNQYKELIDGNDFELDPKKPEEKKKIEEVKKLVKQRLEANIADIEDSLKRLDNVDKVLMHLQNLDTKVCSP